MSVVMSFFSRRFKYLNLRVGPLQYILWLGTNGGLSELFQDVWQFRRNVDLLWTINGFVLLRHNSPFQNKMLMYRLHGRKDCMKSRWRVFGYYDDTKQYSRQALRVEKNNMAPMIPEFGLKIRSIDFFLESAGKPGFVLLWFLPCE